MDEHLMRKGLEHKLYTSIVMQKVIKQYQMDQHLMQRELEQKHQKTIHMQKEQVLQLLVCLVLMQKEEVLQLLVVEELMLKEAKLDQEIMDIQKEMKQLKL